MLESQVRYYSISEISTILKISRSSIARGLKKKIPPFDSAIRIGRRVLIPSDSLNSLAKYQPNYKAGA